MRKAQESKAMSDADLRDLRKKLEDHLEESGEIRSDLKFLKKAFWLLAGGLISFNVMLAIALLNVLVHR
jgi:hypothetical protein